MVAKGRRTVGLLQHSKESIKVQKAVYAGNLYTRWKLILFGNKEFKALLEKKIADGAIVIFTSLIWM